MFNHIYSQIVSTADFVSVIGLFPRTTLICTNLHWVALVSFMMIALSVLLGVVIFELHEDAVFYIGFSLLYIYGIATSIGLVIVFKGRPKKVKEIPKEV